MSIRETIDWGIDLGTTNSSIALLEGKDVQIIKNNEGDEVTSSAVYEKKTRQSVVKRVGKTAKNRLGQDHKNVAWTSRGSSYFLFLLGIQGESIFQQLLRQDFYPQGRAVLHDRQS